MLLVAWKFLKQYSWNLAVVVVFLIICTLCLNNIIIYTPDSARYVTWAKSIAFFKGFYDDTNPDPSRYVVHAPLYPVLLAPLARFFPHSVVAAKACTTVFGALALILFSVWLGKRVSRTMSVLACMAIAVNPLFILYSTQVLSDIPFVACLVLFFISFEKLETDGRPNAVVLCLATITAAFLLREVGLTVMLTAVSIYGLRKQYDRAALFLLVPALVYLIWIIRNELIVASVEFPSMRNSQVFLTHLFTPQDSSIFQELARRVWNNLNVYKDLIGLVAFLPEYRSSPYGAVSPDSLQPVYAYLKLMKFPIALGSMGISIFGLVISWKNSITAKVTTTFLVLYAIPLLLYPINDIRFLLPFLIVIVYYGILGWSQFLDVLKKRLPLWLAHVVSIAVVAFCLLPNLGWVGDFLANNVIYTNIHSDTNSSSRLLDLPPYFHRPVDLAAREIVRISDSSTTVGTVWKEASFWLDGRKVVEINPYAIVDAFDYAIRDFEIKYLLVAVGITGIREYEAQMAQSRRYEFSTVARVGNLEVVEIHEKKRKTQNGQLQPAESEYPAQSREADNVRQRLRRAIALLESRPLQAESLLKDLWNEKGSFASVVFYTAVAKEFSDSLSQAGNLYRRFSQLSQAGSLLTQAWYHLEVISRLQGALSEKNPIKRAERLNVVAVNYWELGFRERALKIVRSSLEADSNFFPSMIIGSLYSLQIGDTSAARKLLDGATRYEPSNELVQSLWSVFSRFDTLRKQPGTPTFLRQKVGIAHDYVRMGLRENAVDELKDVLRIDPDNPEALSLLADIYILKRRLLPARKTLMHLIEVNRNDTVAKDKLDGLLSRWHENS